MCHATELYPWPSEVVVTANASSFTFLVTILNKMLVEHYVQYLISHYKLGN